MLDFKLKNPCWGSVCTLWLLTREHQLIHSQKSEGGVSDSTLVSSYDFHLEEVGVTAPTNLKSCPFFFLKEAVQQLLLFEARIMNILCGLTVKLLLNRQKEQWRAERRSNYALTQARTG